MNALFDLQSLIAELNSQNLVLSDVETANVMSNGIIRVMEELPDGWEEVEELPAASSQFVGKVRKCGSKVYSC